ncbi:hypothetical protein M422DRAFT_108117, partial [Sphaerobolus stellatus SS14]
SATMPPAILQDVCDTLQIVHANSYHLNLGNRRPNLKYEVQKIKNKTPESIGLLFPEILPNQFPRAIVFVDQIDDSMRLCRWLRIRYPDKKERIHFYNSRRSLEAKTELTTKMRGGKIDIFLTTVALALGMDFKDVGLVVQWLAPTTLEDWYRKAGRGGRD